MIERVYGLGSHANTVSEEDIVMLTTVCRR